MDGIFDALSNGFDSAFGVFETGFYGAFAVLPLIAGAALLIVGLFELFRELRGHKIRAEAEVVGMEWKSDPFDNAPPMACPRLRVTLNGEQRELFNEAYASSHRRFREGMRVRIRVNPDDPDDYYIDELFTPARFCLALGAGMVVFGVVMWRNFFG